MSKISTKQIGDDKLPNKFWLSICNDYYYLNGDCWDWISDKNLFKATGKTVGIFNTFEYAKQAADNICLGEMFDGVTANTVSIEDRLSGQVYEKSKYLEFEKGRLLENEQEDIGFSIKREKEL